MGNHGHQLVPERVREGVRQGIAYACRTEDSNRPECTGSAALGTPAPGRQRRSPCGPGVVLDSGAASPAPRSTRASVPTATTSSLPAPKTTGSAWRGPNGPHRQDRSTGEAARAAGAAPRGHLSVDEAVAVADLVPGTHSVARSSHSQGNPVRQLTETPRAAERRPRDSPDSAPRCTSLVANDRYGPTGVSRMAHRHRALSRAILRTLERECT